METYERLLARATAIGRRQELSWTVRAVALGIVIGFMFGGIGIARAGGAFGIPGAVLGALIFGIAGNRIGVELDRKAAASTSSGV